MTNNNWPIILGAVAVLILLLSVSAVVGRLLEPPEETILIVEPNDSEAVFGTILPQAVQEQTSEEKAEPEQEPDTETEDEKEALVKGSDIELVEPVEEPADIKDEPLAEKAQPESIVYSGTGFKWSGSPPPPSSPAPPTGNGEEEEEEEEEEEPAPPVEEEQPIVCSPPFPEPMRGEQVYSVSGLAANPRITKVTIGPLDVNKFATQTVTVLARDTAGNNITLVQGEAFTDNTSVVFEMELISGTETDGAWQGQWHNEDEYCGNYRLAVRASSASGSSQAVLTFR